jgi:hypothetical protein
MWLSKLVRRCPPGRRREQSSAPAPRGGDYESLTQTRATMWLSKLVPIEALNFPNRWDGRR